MLTRIITLCALISLLSGFSCSNQVAEFAQQKKSTPGVAKNQKQTSSKAQNGLPISTVAANAEFTYQIKEFGETLETIALRLYGNGARWKEIAELNQITNPKTIRVGQTLAIPEKATVNETEGAILVIRSFRRHFDLPLSGPEYDAAVQFALSPTRHVTKVARKVASTPQPTPPEKAALDKEVYPAEEPEETSKVQVAPTQAEPVVTPAVVPKVAKAQAAPVHPTVTQAIEQIQKQNYDEAFEVVVSRRFLQSAQELRRSGLVWIEGTAAESVYKMLGQGAGQRRPASDQKTESLRKKLKRYDGRVGREIACAKVPAERGNQSVTVMRCIGYSARSKDSQPNGPDSESLKPGQVSTPAVQFTP